VATQRKPKKASASKPHPADLATVAAIEAEAARAEARLAARSPDPFPTPEDIARLGKVEVQEFDTRSIKLGSTRGSSPAALVFLRHYG